MSNYISILKEFDRTICSEIKKLQKICETFEIPLTEGKHWSDFLKQAFNKIKNSDLSKKYNFRDDLIQDDVQLMKSAFETTGLHHNPRNWKLFGKLIDWLIEYSGTTPDRYTSFVNTTFGSILHIFTQLFSGNPKEMSEKENEQTVQKINEIAKMNVQQILDFVEKEQDKFNKREIEKTKSIKNENKGYEAIEIESYEQMNQMFGGDITGAGKSATSGWCHSNGKSTYDSWVGKSNKFVVFAKKGWENIQPPSNPISAFDEYGLSLIACLFSASGVLKNETLRWNHVVSPIKDGQSRGVDHAFNDSIAELSEVVGKELVENVIKKIENLNAPMIQHAQQQLFKGTTATQKDGEIIKSLGIDELTIPSHITKIDNNAFNNCDTLKSVMIPDSVTSIGKYAFSNCYSLASVTIGNRVTSIEYEAFSSCTSLASVTIGNRVTSIGDFAFYYCPILKSVTIPDSVTSIGSHAFYYCYSLASVTIPDSVTSIGEGAFRDCPSLASVTIPDSVTSIGHWAFGDCQNLKELIFKGKSMNEVQSMKNYPWRIENPEHVIKIR